MRTCRPIALLLVACSVAGTGACSGGDALGPLPTASPRPSASPSPTPTTRNLALGDLPSGQGWAELDYDGSLRTGLGECAGMAEVTDVTHSPELANAGVGRFSVVTDVATVASAATAARDLRILANSQQCLEALAAPRGDLRGGPIQVGPLPVPVRRPGIGYRITTTLNDRGYVFDVEYLLVLTSAGNREGLLLAYCANGTFDRPLLGRLVRTFQTRLANATA